MAKFAESLLVTITNWLKYNARKDIKRPVWFRLDHGLFENEEFYDFTHAELCVWIYLLCCASKKSSGTVLLNYDHAKKFARVSKHDINSSLEKLQRNQCVLVNRTDHVRDAAGIRPDDVRDPAATLQDTTLQDTTLQDTTEQKTLAHSRFEFDSLYQKYPKKLGKSEGMKKARREIKTPEDFEALSRAIDHFNTHHARQKTDPQFIPYFSTFMSSWRDWLEPVATAQILPIKDPLAEQLERERLEIRRRLEEEERRYNEGVAQ